MPELSVFAGPGGGWTVWTVPLAMILLVCRGALAVDDRVDGSTHDDSNHATSPDQACRILGGPVLGACQDAI